MMIAVAGFVGFFGALCMWLVVYYWVGIEPGGVNVDGDDRDRTLIDYEESLKK